MPWQATAWHPAVAAQLPLPGGGEVGLARLEIQEGKGVGNACASGKAVPQWCWQGCHFAPQPNCRFNADAKAGHAFGIFMASFGALRPGGLRRRLTWALGHPL
jgi:hypothetical protein